MKEPNARIPRPLVVAAAWLSVVVLAIASLFVALLLSGMFLSEYDESAVAARFISVFGFFGIQVLVLVAIILWRRRTRAYARHLLIGTFVGLALYVLFFIGGAVAFVATNASQAASDGECSSAQEQYAAYGAAIIPIGTDKGIGSGVVVDGEGTVITAYHVIEDANEVYANYSTGRVNMAVVDRAAHYDLAVLKLEKFEATHFSLATNYSAGDEVLAYGYPFNALTAGSPSITRGIVSRILTIADLRMTHSDLPDGLEYIQTDAAINPGNSGGALIGACGVVGIVVSVSDSAQVSQYVGAVSEQGIAFAVSSKTAAQAFGLPIAHE